MYNQLAGGVLLSRLITSNILLLIITIIIITAPLGIYLERRMARMLLRMVERVAMDWGRDRHGIGKNQHPFFVTFFFISEDLGPTTE